jgi:inner membrane protein
MMSSVGHLLVGAAASRYALPRPSGPRRLAIAVLMIGISIAPDLDLAVLPALGVPDSLTLGHRGATHSLAVALAVVVIVTLLALAVRLPARRVAVGAFVSIGSHAILDSLTRGPGVAWLWPFSSVRFPTFPILPMAPLEHLLSTRGLVLLVAEILVFSPFALYAFRRSEDRGLAEPQT